MEPCGATVAPHGATVEPHGSTLITWPADLTTANRSEHNSKQNKLVRSVEQTSMGGVQNVLLCSREWTVKWQCFVRMVFKILAYTQDMYKRWKGEYQYYVWLVFKMKGYPQSYVRESKRRGFKL